MNSVKGCKGGYEEDGHVMGLQSFCNISISPLVTIRYASISKEQFNKFFLQELDTVARPTYSKLEFGELPGVVRRIFPPDPVCFPNLAQHFFAALLEAKV